MGFGSRYRYTLRMLGIRCLMFLENVRFRRWILLMEEGRGLSFVGSETEDGLGQA